MKGKIVRQYFLSFKKEQFFKNIVKKYNPSKLEIEVILENITKIDKIFSNFNNNLNVLLYGAVQSGKTKYILSLAHLAFKYNYNFIIYISGNKNILYEQGIKEFQNSFKKNKNVRFIAYTNKNIDLRQVDSKLKIVIFIKKIQKDILEIEQLVEERDFSKYKFLIIDDECDNATPNIKNKKKNSLINRVISKLSNRENVSYIGSTGTPYHSLIMRDQPKPDKVLVLKNPKNYKGLQYHKKRNFYKEIYLEKGKRDKLLEKILKIFIDDSVKEWKTSNPQLIINIDHTKKEINEIYKKAQMFLKGFEAKFYFETKTDHYNFVRSLKINKLVSDECNKNKTFIYNKPNINIGCFMISRGFRFDELTHVLIYTKAKKLALDTFVQRCRWFGYQNWNVKIYANKSLITLYTKIAPKVDKEIRELFLKNEDLNKETNDYLNIILKKHDINNNTILSSKRINNEKRKI